MNKAKTNRKFVSIIIGTESIKQDFPLKYTIYLVYLFWLVDGSFFENLFKWVGSFTWIRGGGGRGGGITLSDEPKLDRDPLGCLNAELEIGVFRSS